MVSVGSQPVAHSDSRIAKDHIYESIRRLAIWLEKNDYRGYDTFDGLSSKLARPFTFNNKFLLIALQQGVRRFPINLRPLLGIAKGHSTKGMGFIAKGYMRLNEATGDAALQTKAEFALQWLIENQVPGLSGACWGNHFDYQSRSFHIAEGCADRGLDLAHRSRVSRRPSTFSKGRLPAGCRECVRAHYARSGTFADGKGVCISYVPTENQPVHNANTLGASLLARTYSHTRNESYRELAEKAMQYTAQYQRSDSSWYYAERSNAHWVDNFHTAYVLDSFKYYIESTGDDRFLKNMTTRIRILEENLFSARWNTQVL